MILKELGELFKTKLFPISSTNILFNQYKDSDPRVDLPNAHEIRRENLMFYMRSFSMKPSVMVVGEAAGPWGCRFSGVPFSGEKQLVEGKLPFLGNRTSKQIPDIQIKKGGPPFTSLSAEVFWAVMKPHFPKFFVWDCVPFHPHDMNNILSVRKPTLEEILSYSGLLEEIEAILKPEAIVAVGRKAELALRIAGISSTYVRHPSRGGKREFSEGVVRFFNGIKRTPMA